MDDRQILKNALEQAKSKLLEQDTFLKQLTAPPAMLATVIMLRKAENTVVISMDGKMAEVLMPEARHVKESVLPGATVRIVPDTMQISYAFPKPIDLGDVGIVKQSLGEDRLEVDYNGTLKVVSSLVKGKEGDKVVLDQTGKVVLRNIGAGEEVFEAESPEKVSWDDIGGQDAAKMALIEAVELPLKHKDVYQRYGKKPTKGVLMYGPPGCGKTMLGKAVATSVAATSGAKSGSGFIYVKGPEILEPYVGLAERTIRQLFQKARAHKQKHGYPAVLFIDEADAILGRRGSGISSDVERTIVPMFLSEMDGLDDSGAIVILTTNRPDVLDPAVVRDGRVDRKVRVGRPTRESAKDIFRMYLSKKPTAKSAVELSTVARNELFCEKKVMFVVDRGSTHTNITLGDLCNGAMIANIVERATQAAMHRDIASKRHSGIREDDVISAVSQTYFETGGVDHKDAIDELSADFNDIRGIKRVAMATA